MVQLASGPTGLKGTPFNSVIAMIDATFHYTPQPFTVGKGTTQQLTSEAGTNEGSAKVFSFAKLSGLSKEATLALFCEHYENVVGDPEGTAHGNIRAFMAV